MKVGLWQYFYHLIAQQIHPLQLHLGVLEGLLLVGGEDVLHVVGEAEYLPPQPVVGLHLLGRPITDLAVAGEVVPGRQLPQSLRPGEEGGGEVADQDFLPGLYLPHTAHLTVPPACEAPDRVRGAGMVDPGGEGEDPGAQVSPLQLVQVPDGERVGLVDPHHPQVPPVLRHQVRPGDVEGEELVLPLLPQGGHPAPQLGQELGQRPGSVRDGELDQGGLRHHQAPGWQGLQGKQAQASPAI